MQISHPSSSREGRATAHGDDPFNCSGKSKSSCFHFFPNRCRGLSCFTCPSLTHGVETGRLEWLSFRPTLSRQVKAGFEQRETKKRGAFINGKNLTHTGMDICELPVVSFFSLSLQLSLPSPPPNGRTKVRAVFFFFFQSFLKYFILIITRPYR